MSREVWLLGRPVAKSLSMPMQNAAFAALGLDIDYRPRELDDAHLPDLIAGIRHDHRIDGANVTIPFKESVIPLLDQLDPVSTRVGAVNTISRAGDRLLGWNTDVLGFRRALDEGGYAVLDKVVAVLGAGGAARAVVTVLDELAARVVIIARHPNRAEQVIGEHGLKNAEARPLTGLAQAIADAALIVNATPADLVSPDLLRPGQRLFDLRSSRSAEGRAMLLHQGAAAFEIWTRRPAPVPVMREALEAAAAVPA